ncbi:MAG: redoxin domain-containing protein [Planctomycetes bacterium]|nr:redoxin domain-containing protein [Planctomycetota bacterium]
MKRSAVWLMALGASLGAWALPVHATLQAPTKQGSPDAQATKLAGLDKELALARKSFEEKMKSAKDDDEREKLGEESPDKLFLPKYQALAEEAKGSETAAKALKQVMLLAGNAGDMDAAKEAAKVMVAEHLDSPEADLLVFAAGQLLGKKEGPKALEELKAKNKTKPVAAALLFMEVQKVGGEKGEDAEELHALYEKMKKDYGTLKLPWGEETYGGMADGWLFVADNLSIGKTAPGFEAVDENGAKWKLEDYRGKVVVIDFWGEW